MVVMVDSEYNPDNDRSLEISTGTIIKIQKW